MIKKYDNPIETLKIKDIDIHGNGISRTSDGREIKVPFTLPKEVVKAEIIETRNENERWAEVISIKHQHPERIKSQCKHFGTCGGCSLQHFGESIYKESKKQNVIKILNEFGIKNCEHIVQDPIIFGPEKRRRINFTARVLRDGLFVMGFSRKNRRSLFDVTECKATVPEFQPLFASFRSILSQIMQPGDKLHIFLTKADNGIDVFIGGVKQHYNDQTKQMFINLSKEHQLARLIIKQKNKREVIWQNDPAHPPYIDFSGYKVRIASNAFLQASKDADLTLAKLVCDNIPPSAQKVADLFAGRGTLSFPMLGQRNIAIDAYECDTHAIEAFKEAIHNNNEQRINIIERNLFTSPLKAEELDKYDFICLDPPRAGCIEQAEEIIKSTKLNTIVYVSCGNDTFARDANILTKCGGFELTKLHPVDQFLWTPHIELVGVFKR